MPRLSTETFGSGDQSWLGSEHGISNARTETLDISAFTAGTHYPDGYIRSGQTVAKVGGMLVPYDATEGTVTGAGIIAGHVLFDAKVSGAADFPVALIDHGRVIASKVPGGFTKPAAAAKLSATTIVYV
ncbi:LamD-like capsid decoration protein [Arthrobacter phage Bauer]|uniref:LamD-like capsid decoration protein n=1 Tax=Arthrobacter phage Bauer TaxID=2985648 RepID=A0A9E7V2H1_9CAUD|nr:LamD-like capsid decoration protein [Arthrobacter phage Bauer]UUG69967.1 LamD-like capsid decoration protein [Arthrobacter phage Zucker]UYM26557.1 LamD-like capsid decoration protein [Arthrobacter phage Bauer]